VDNTRHEDGVPTTQTDWFNYGGLTREVSLITVPEAFIDQYDLHLSARRIRTRIEGWVHVRGAAGQIEISIPELDAKGTIPRTADGGAPAADGFRKFVELSVPALKLWSPESPKLYKVEMKVGADSIEDEIGFRTIEVKGTEILLNGKPIFLRGVCIHAEAPYRTGRAYSDKDAETLLGWAKELGANYVRLAHYPHDETMLRAADRMGILVWARIRSTGRCNSTIPPSMPTRSISWKKRSVPRAIMRRSFCGRWPMRRLSTMRAPSSSALAARARELDPTRLITAALLVHTDKNGDRSTKVVDDPLGAVSGCAGNE
jgi:beta-glucuronidase